MSTSVFNVWKKKHFVVAVIYLPLPINILGSFIFYFYLFSGCTEWLMGS